MRWLKVLDWPESATRPLFKKAQFPIFEGETNPLVRGVRTDIDSTQIDYLPCKLKLTWPTPDLMSQHTTVRRYDTGTVLPLTDLIHPLPLPSFSVGINNCWQGPMQYPYNPSIQVWLHCRIQK
jgi:hypothetical protein